LRAQSGGRQIRRPGTLMAIGISSSALLNYYQAKAGVSLTASGGSGIAGSTTGSTISTGPTPPWTNTASVRQINSLIQSAMSGQSLFNPNAVKVSDPNASPNYKNLFALYQGVAALQDLANEAGTKGVTDSQIARLQAAFAGGLGQLSTFLDSAPFRGFNVAQGAVTAQAQTAGGVPAETDVYNTGVLVSGSSAVAVGAFQGSVKFDMTVTLPSGKTKVVNFNLDDMGSTTRSLSNVVSYLNSQLTVAGVATRFAVNRTAGAVTTTTVNSKTLTSPPGPDQFSMQIKGNSVEKLSFSTASSVPAVYLTQTAGITADKVIPGSGKTADSKLQLVKLTTNPTATNAKISTDTLASTAKDAIATAATADGSVYVLANVTGAVPAGEIGGGQAIVGSQDVALLKYDSAGNLMFSHVLGASDSASGYGLAVSSDGMVAVTGSATGLVTGDGTASSATTSTGFVSVYASQGQPLWTSMVGAGAAGQVNQAAFGADGSLYVAGTTTITGTEITNGFLAGFSATGAQKFTTSLGSATQNRVTGLAVSGTSIVTAGVQGGDAVAQSFQIQATGAPTLTATRDLGALNGGSVAGIAVNADGSIIIAGSTHNGALNAGTITSAYTAGEAAYVAHLSADLTPSSSDTLAYYGGASGDVRVTAVASSGGQAYIAGQVVNTSSGSTAYDGFAAQIDPLTGASGWSDRYTGLDHIVAPNSIAVGATGASWLDALGLPSGTLNFAPTQTVGLSTLAGLPASAQGLIPTQTLVANSALRAGEQFTIKTNYSGAAQTVTIEADDTLQSLSQKISRASGFSATASETTSNGVQKLQIKPSYAGVQITLGAGKNGANALPALGLTEGVVTANATAKAARAGATVTAANSNSLKANYAMLLPSTLNLDTSAGIKQAQAVLGATVVAIKQIYTDLTTPASTSRAGSNGPVPAYLTSEIASYGAALARLQANNPNG
jgi:hypothetical protein